MSIRFSCDQCNHTLETPDGSEGKPCRCPQCQALMSVPMGSRPDQDFGGFTGQSSAATSGGSSFGSGVPMDSNPYAAPPAPSNPFAPGSVTPGSVGSVPPQVGSSSKGTNALIMGIFSLLLALFSCACCGLFQPFAIGLGIAALVTAKKELKMIKTGLLPPSTQTEATIGMVLGIIGIVLGVIGLGSMVVFVVLEMMK